MKILFALLLLVATSGFAQGPGGTPPARLESELAQLPPYCLDAQSYTQQFDMGNPTASQRRWMGQLGSTFGHIHHYCWALQTSMRARSPLISEQERRALFAGAVKDANYVIERAPPDFVLLPEIFLRMGQFSVGQGDVVGALEYFERSRRAKPDYWPAYVEMAKANAGIGRRQVAEEVLKAGLQAIPDEPNILRELEALRAAPAGGRKKPGSK